MAHSDMLILKIFSNLDGYPTDRQIRAAYEEAARL